MHLPIDPSAPWPVHALAFTGLVAHIAGAAVGMVSGMVAMFTRKGGRLHRQAGNVFFVAMLIMSAVAAVVAPLLPDRISAVMGLFTFYLTATAWIVVRRPAMSVGRLEKVAPLVPLFVAVCGVLIARIGAGMPRGIIDGVPSQIGYGIAVVALIAFASDLRMLRRGGLAGPSRIARHLWRMSLALFIVWGSFAGQPKAQPEAVRNASWLFLPALGVLVLMVFWLIRIRLPARRRATSATRTPLNQGA